MTESEWLAATEPRFLVEYSGAITSNRKRWCFVSACCRRIQKLIPGEEPAALISVAEQFADGQATDEEMARARLAALRWSWDYPASFAQEELLRAINQLLYVNPGAGPNWVAILHSVTLAESRAGGSPASLQAATANQADLARHILGNPFQPLPVLGNPPDAVHKFAEAVYAREPVHFALHDALLEAGYADVAVHFHEPYHPRGCWALDVILGKT